MDTNKTKRVRGIIKWFSQMKGYGFIALPDGKDAFVHHSAVESREPLKEGQTVECDITEGAKGRKAINVVPVT